MSPSDLSHIPPRPEDEAGEGAAPIRALELFAGIGGFGAAVGASAQVVCAIDLSDHVLGVITHNAPHVLTRQLNLEFIRAAELARHNAELWWMSPPCQPYTVRGLQRDLEDRRANSLLHMLELIAQVGPTHLAMENVQGFWDSTARQRVLSLLDTQGYEVAERLLCPTELGVPAKRERYYLVASREGLLPPSEPLRAMSPLLADYLDEDDQVDEALYVPDEDIARHGHGMRVFEAHALDQPPLNCFTSAYGKTFRYSGSFLRTAQGRIRMFSPAELLRLLHFPPNYDFPQKLTLRQRYKYVGNSLSVLAVREVLRRLPPLVAIT